MGDPPGRIIENFIHSMTGHTVENFCKVRVSLIRVDVRSGLTVFYLTEFDDFSACKTKLLIVVQDSVHVFNPHGVNWSVKNVPFLVTCDAGASHADHGR